MIQVSPPSFWWNPDFNHRPMSLVPNFPGLQLHPNNELMENITSKDFMDPKCDCANATTANGECIHSGNCRKSMAIHEATCEECGCFHIGNTQQKPKNRMNQHFADVKNLVNNGDFSDSFAKHFASHFNNNDNNGGITKGDVRNVTNTETLWQGKPIWQWKAISLPHWSHENQHKEFCPLCAWMGCVSPILMWHNQKRV